MGDAMTRFARIAPIVLLLFLAGCGGGGTTAPDPDPDPNPNPDPDTPVFGQLAELIGEWTFFYSFAGEDTASGSISLLGSHNVRIGSDQKVFVEFSAGVEREVESSYADGVLSLNIDDYNYFIYDPLCGENAEVVGSNTWTFVNPKDPVPGNGSATILASRTSPCSQSGTSGNYTGMLVPRPKDILDSLSGEWIFETSSLPGGPMQTRITLDEQYAQDLESGDIWAWGYYNNTLYLQGKYLFNIGDLPGCGEAAYDYYQRLQVPLLPGSTGGQVTGTFMEVLKSNECPDEVAEAPLSGAFIQTTDFEEAPAGQ